MTPQMIADLLRKKGVEFSEMGPDQISLTDKRPGLTKRYWFERGSLIVGVLFCDMSIYGSNILSIYRSIDRGYSWENLALVPTPDIAAHILCEQFGIDPREEVRLIHA